MAKEDNLIPFNELTEKEQRKIASMGGKASGEVRKRKKLIKDNIELLLSLPIKNDKMKSQLKALGIEEDEMTNQMAMTIAMWQKAIKGDVSAFNSLRDTIGEKPKEVVEHSGEINNPYSKLTEEELRKLAEEE